MNILRISFIAAIAYTYCVTVTRQEEDYHDISNWAKKRSKRFLIFDTSGVSKVSRRRAQIKLFSIQFIISLALPVDLGDKKPWRALSSAWNFQWQHMLPTTTQLWWNSTYFPAEGRQFSSQSVTPTQRSFKKSEDLTATFLYSIFENYMNNKGVNGRACLQRAICDNAQVHYVGGLFDRIYQRLLTPEQRMEDHYKDAFIMGSKGVNCEKSFSACPKGDSLFDDFVKIEEVP